MPQDYEKFIGPDGVVRIGHSLTRREPEPKMPEQPQPQPQQRPVAPKVKPAQLQKAAQPVQAAPTPASKPVTFGGTEAGKRLREVLALPEADGKLAMAAQLALISGATASGARSILAGLPEGQALDLKPAAALDPETARALAILTAPEAAIRPKQAVGLVLETAMEVAGALQLLAQLPEEPRIERQRIPSIAERAAQEREFGASFEPTGLTKQEKIKASWDAAFARLNGSSGAPPKPQAPTPAPPPEWSSDVKKP